MPKRELRLVAKAEAPEARPRAAKAPSSAFAEAGRHIPQAVNAISFSSGKSSSVLLTAAASLFSYDPPSLLITLDEATFAAFREADGSAFSVHVLTANQRDLAESLVRAVSRRAEAGHCRDDLAETAALSLSSGAAVTFGCALEEVILRHDRALLIGRVCHVRLVDRSSALVSWRGLFDQLGWSEQEISRAVGLAPVDR